METTDENEEFEAVPDIDEHYFKKLGEKSEEETSQNIQFSSNFNFS